MNFLRNITAAGIAGCMLLMGTVPEAAVLTAAAESSTPDAAAVDPEVAFKDVLDMFRKNVSEGWANFDGTTAEGLLNSEDLSVVSPLWLDEYKDKGLDEVGYDYHDGVLSISVSGVYDCVDGYAIKDGKIIHLCSAGEKTAYKISFPYIENIVLDEATDASQDTSYDLVDGALVPKSARKQDKDGKYYRTEEFTLQKDGSFVYNWQEVDSSKYYTWGATRPYPLTMLSNGMEQAETVPATEAATDAEVDPEVAFKDVLDMFRKNVSEGWANFDGTTAEGLLNSEDLSVVSPLWLDEYKDKGLDEVGYEYDTNKGCLYIGVSDSYKGADVYSLKDGKPVHLCASGETYTINYPVTADFRPDEATYIQLHYRVTDGVMTPTYAYKEGNGYWYSDSVTLNSDGSYNFDWKETTRYDTHYTPVMMLTFTSHRLGQPATEPTEPAADSLYKITAPEIPALKAGQEYAFDVTVTRTDGKPVGTVNGFRKMGEDDAYYASWETVTSDTDKATVKVTLRAEKPYTGDVTLGLASQIEGVDSKNVSEGSFSLTITEAADSLYKITAPEIPALNAGQEYAFDVTVTRTDGKPVGTVNGFRKMGEDDAYYASWETVTSDTDKATVKVTLRAEKPYTGDVTLGLAAQIEGVDSKNVSEAAFALTITEAADSLYKITAPEIPALKAGQEYAFDVTVTRTDGKPVGTVNGFRKMGEDDAYYASWETVTSDTDKATVKVTLRAEKLYTGDVTLGLASQIEGVDSKNVSEGSFSLTITEAADSLYKITVPEIPEMVTDRDYEFKVTVTRTDGKPVGSVESFRKLGEDDSYYAVWSAVTSNESTVTVPVLLTPKKPFSGEVQLGISMQITDADGSIVPAEQISEAAFALTITEPRSVELKLPPIPALSPGETYHFNAEMILSSADDFKAVKSGGAGFSDAYSVTWETVIFDQEGQTSYQIPFTITLGDSAEGTIEVNLAENMYPFIYNDGNGIATKDMITAYPLLIAVKGGAEAFDPAAVEGLGDLNGDSTVNASDAAMMLIAAAKIGAGNESGLTPAQEKQADLNGDGIVNASDAALTLQYAAMIGAGGEGTLADYLKARK